MSENKPTVKDRWAKLETWKKRLAAIAGILGAIIALGTPVWAGVDRLATDAEVQAAVQEVTDSFDTYQIEQEQKDKEKAIRDARWRLEDIEYRLLDPLLPEIQRAALEQAKTKLLRRIRCIQEANHFCD